jgi:hypothetical protein
MRNLILTGFLLGLLVGFLIGVSTGVVLTRGPAQCQEDEVAMWPMKNGEFVSYENTHCVPLDRI